MPRLYKQIRPGSDYDFSLNLLRKFKQLHLQVLTKSGLMVGLGETDAEIMSSLQDRRTHGVDMVTIGQYLAPSPHHTPVLRYVHPETFSEYARQAYAMGRWDLAMAHRHPWCAVLTTQINKHTPPVWSESALYPFTNVIRHV